MSIRRISESSVDRQFTAKALIGKDVYDSGNKKVGEIRDVVLDSSRAPQLATALSMRSDNRSSSTSTTSGSVAGSTSSTSSTGSTAGSTTSGVDTTRSSSLSSADLGALSAFGSSEPAAIVSYGGFMGAGGTLFRVPLSQLRYDSGSDHLMLNVSDSELSSLKNADTGRNVAE